MTSPSRHEYGLKYFLPLSRVSPRAMAEPTISGDSSTNLRVIVYSSLSFLRLSLAIQETDMVLDSTLLRIWSTLADVIVSMSAADLVASCSSSRSVTLVKITVLRM